MNSEFGSYTEMRPLKLGNNFFPHTLVNQLICIQLLEPFEILSGCKKQSKASILFFPEAFAVSKPSAGSFSAGPAAAASLADFQTVTVSSSPAEQILAFPPLFAQTESIFFKQRFLFSLGSHPPRGAGNDPGWRRPRTAVPHAAARPLLTAPLTPGFTCVWTRFIVLLNLLFLFYCRENLARSILMCLPNHHTA